MERSPSSVRPCFKLRCWLAVAFFAVMLPGGHAAVPQGFGFLRFLYGRQAPGLMDYSILACASGAVALTFLPWSRKVVVLDVVAVLMYLATLIMIHRTWADPFDLRILLVTATPWAILSLALIVRDAIR